MCHSTLITKGILSCTAKAWWKLVHYYLSPIKRDNMLSPNRASLVAGIIEGNKIDVVRFIAKEICDRMVSTNTTLTFSCLLM